MNYLLNYQNKIFCKKFNINYIFLNLSLLLTVLSLFVGGMPMKLMALLITLLYVFVSKNIFYNIYKNNTAIFLIIPMFLGLIFSYEHDFKDIFRDIFLFAIPYVYYLAGVTLNFNNFDYRRLVYIYSLIYCLFFVFFSIVNYLNYGFLNIQIIRDFVSPGSFLLVICIFFLYSESNSNIFLNFLFIFTQLIFIIQSSRTYFIIIFIFFFDKFFKLRKYTILFIIIIIIAMTYIFRTELQEVDVFNKVFLELSFKDNWTEADMGTSYRAYEAITAFKTFLNYSWLNIIFGGGFGALVNLDMPVVLAQVEYNAVPWVHNGFMFILVKVGILGILSYIVFFFRVIKKSIFLENAFYKSILRLTIVGMLIANIVICGLFSTEFAYAYILLGYFSSKIL